MFLKEINNSFSMQGEMNFSFRGIAVKTNGYYEGYSVMELGDKLLKMYNSNNPNINNNFDELSGERVLNKMENKLLRFKDFQKI